MVEYLPHVGLLGVVVWAIRLEGRVNTGEALAVERNTHYTERDTDIRERLTRIEDKLDNAAIALGVAGGLIRHTE
jgi:hypothetical protein